MGSDSVARNVHTFLNENEVHIRPVDEEFVQVCSVHLFGGSLNPTRHAGRKHKEGNTCEVINTITAIALGLALNE